MFIKSSGGFTLVELLIALAIMGTISAFTIPKVIAVQQSTSMNSVAKETASMVSAAFSKYQLDYNISSSTTGGALTPYMNYVKVDTATTGALDDSPGFGSRSCSNANPCLRLANGALLQYESGASFGGTGSGQALFFFLDPDGSYSNSTYGSNGNGKAVRIAIKYSGRITTMGASEMDLCNSSYCLGASSAWDPSWFNW